MSIPSNLQWAAADERAVGFIRVLTIDAVQRAGSGHPDTAMSLASAQAGITAPGRLSVADAGASIEADHFGISAAYQKIYQEFGITAERVAAAARDSLARVRA